MTANTDPAMIAMEQDRLTMAPIDFNRKYYPETIARLERLRTSLKEHPNGTRPARSPM